MPYIVIAYELRDIDGEAKRIYLDDTEKYFESLDMQDAKDYMEYLTKKNLTVDASPITVLKQGDLSVEGLYMMDALAKLTDYEKQILGL